jgi:hypothetical protein
MEAEAIGRRPQDLCPRASRTIHRHAYRRRLEGLGAPSIAGREQIIDSSWQVVDGDHIGLCG